MKAACAALALLLAAEAHAVKGNGVGNGGDAVLCRKSAGSVFDGYYSLDFLAQYDPTSLPVAMATLDASLDRIERGLKAKLPALLLSFQEFRLTLFNDRNMTLERIWERAPFGLVDLKDEELVTLLPANCVSGDKAQISQAVIRQPPSVSGLPPGKILYRFVPTVVDQLAQSNPVQLSFLLVHEWLWDFSSNVARNRRINYWLHSDRLDLWSQNEWAQNLQGIGFTMPGMPDPVYSDAVCPPHADSLSFLTDPKRANARDPILLGTGQAHQRKWNCSTSSGLCGTTWDVSSSFAKNFGTPIRLQISNGTLRIESGPKLRSVVHAECRIDTLRGRVETCGYLVGPSGYRYYPDMRPEVVIGNGCVIFKSRASTWAGKWDEISDVRIFFPKAAFPVGTP